jgi:hypothetical protein
MEAVENQPEEFTFSYKAKLHEAEWIHSALNGFYEQMIDDVLRVIRGGKEASVYQCLANPAVGAPYLAAKIYRPRMFRNLKNDHIYREGRGDLDSSGNLVTNDGMLHAMRKRTRYGLELLHTSWITHEYKTLQILHAAGADVPQPYASGHNTILMEYIGGEEAAADTLNSIELPPPRRNPCSSACCTISRSCSTTTASTATCPLTTSCIGMARSPDRFPAGHRAAAKYEQLPHLRARRGAHLRILWTPGCQSQRA